MHDMQQHATEAMFNLLVAISRAPLSLAIAAVVLGAALLSPGARAAEPIASCCGEEVENWEGYEGGSSRTRVKAIHYDDIWQRIESGMALGYHLHRAAVRTELDRLVRHRPSLYEMLENSKPYLHYIVGEVDRRNIPLEIALLPFIESQFNPHSLSEYGAAGIWQFMPSTARHFKLEMSWWFDARRDPVLATQKALDYLERLNQQFNGDWMLAVAAYNTGPARVKEIQADSVNRGQSGDFWSLNLPRQTRRYVPAMLALAEIVRWGQVNGDPLPHIDNQPYFTVVELPAQIDLLYPITRTGMHPEDFFRLNAGYKRWAPNPERPARILLPTDYAAEFRENLSAEDSPAPVRWVSHLVRPGDTLSKIAELFKCRVSILRQLNNIFDDRELEAGTYILVPDQPQEDLLPRGGLIIRQTFPEDTVASLADYYGVNAQQVRRAAGLQEGEELQPDTRIKLHLGPTIPQTAIGLRSAYYRIRPGDTLSAIALRFNTTVGELKTINEVDAASLYPGNRIRIPLPEQP